LGGNLEDVVDWYRTEWQMRMLSYLAARRYGNLSELSQAFKSKAINVADDGTPVALIIDDDRTFCSYEWRPASDDMMFKGGGLHELGEEALNLLGIPTEHYDVTDEMLNDRYD
jgi:hypothetical protein